MVASSTSPSYCPARMGLSFFMLAAREEGRWRDRQKRTGGECREPGGSREAGKKRRKEENQRRTLRSEERRGSALTPLLLERMLNQ